MQDRTLIIGAGLTGLTIAYLLHRAGRKSLVLEARSRPGGRILTSRRDAGTPLELGATWLGTKHDQLVSLLDELGLPTFEQVTGGRAIYEAISTSPAQVVQLPHNDQPSYRIAGGSDALINALVKALPAGTIRYGKIVDSVKETAEGVEVGTGNDTYVAKNVVSTLPPNLLVNTISFLPQLPENLASLARQTQTWMGESIKVGLRYAQPFWRENGRPGGTIFSNVGPVSEMYDHTNIQNNQYALKGFLNGTYFSLSRAERRQMVLTQLEKYYGEIVHDYLAYEEAVWRNEPFTYVANDGHVLPHQNNGHHAFRQEYWNGKLLIAGSETAAQYPGYMDGAVRSAQRCSNLILNDSATKTRT